MANPVNKITSANAVSVTEVARFEVLISPTGLAFLPDGRTLASGHLDGTVRLWNVPDKVLLRTITGPIRYKTTVVFSPDGNSVASYVGDGATYELQLWDLANGSILPTPEAGFLDYVSFSPDGQLLAVATEQGIQLWNTMSMQLTNTLVRLNSYINSIDWSNDGQLLAYGAGNLVMLWRLIDTSLLHTLAIKAYDKPENDEDEVWSVAFSPDGKLLAAGTAGGAVEIWSVDDARLLFTLEAHTDCVDSLAFLSAGQILASASRDTNINLWNISEGALQSTLQGHTGWVKNLAVSRQGTLLASASHDQTIRLWAVP